MSKPMSKDQRMRAMGQVLCPICDGDGYWGDPEYGPAGNCRECGGSGYVAEAVAKAIEQELEE